MRRLLQDFAESFDVECRVRNSRIGELFEQMVVNLDAQSLPDWGMPGDATEVMNLPDDRFLQFYYRPHLFPDMDLKLRLAHKLQFHLLPRDVPRNAPVSVAAVLESYCHLSGDLFGWEMLSDGKFLMWIVDLSGHGVKAGLAAACLKVLIDNLQRRSHLADFVGSLNETLCRCSRQDNLFATGCFIVIDPDGVASYTSAGHPPALVRHREGGIRELKRNSKPIGLFDGEQYEVDQFDLAPDDALLLYTDGVVERTNVDEQQFGMGRLHELLGKAGGTPEAITGELYRGIASYQDMAKLEDDVTFLVAKMRED